MHAWKMVIDNLESINEKSNTLRLNLLNYQYVYIAWCIGNKNTANAEHYLDLAKKSGIFRISKI